MEKSVKLTNHGVQRTKDRTGLSKRIADKNAQKALEHGITHREAKSGLKRYFDRLYLTEQKANNIRVYHHHVYLFRGKCLITVMTLPQHLCKLADKIQKQKDEERDENS